MPPKPDGRHSPRFDNREPASTSETQLKQLMLELKASNDEIKNQNVQILSNQAKLLERLDTNTKDIACLKSENKKLNDKLNVLEEKFIKLDQYSRKDVVILTGLQFTQGEQQRTLETKVLDFIESITDKQFNIHDFSAIHRNGIRCKDNGRPPSITVKFLRLHDKDLIFSKLSINKRKNLYPELNIHHCMSEGMIDIQSSIATLPSVKFVKFMGANRYFNVCCKDGDNDDFFLNRIQNVEHFKTELNKRNRNSRPMNNA